MADGAAYLPVQFKVTTPLDRATLDPRMVENDARGLPEAVYTKTAIIVGSGPSALDPALWERLKAIEAQPFGQVRPIVVACNGALKLFVEHGLRPDFWTCCDPQEQVLDFIPYPAPTETRYLLATKCPESLFERLRNHDVWAWRLDDMNRTKDKLHVTCAVSITLVTQNLLRFMGYHRFETYGWDCCYLDGEHHATPQPKPIGEMPFEIVDDSRAGVAANYQSGRPFVRHSFQIAPQWAAELGDACVHAHNFQSMGYEIIVHGPGAVGALLRAKKLIA
jgi:hypothetical protein